MKLLIVWYYTSMPVVILKNIIALIYYCTLFRLKYKIIFFNFSANQLS